MARSCPQQTGRITPPVLLTYMYYPEGLPPVGDFARGRAGNGYDFLGVTSGIGPVFEPPEAFQSTARPLPARLAL